MPNIEIHAKEKKVELRARIVKILQEIGLGEEAITTEIICTPKSCDGEERDMPFIRICCTNIREMEKIIEAFRRHRIGVDIEMLLLRGFIPAEEVS